MFYLGILRKKVCIFLFCQSYAALGDLTLDSNLSVDKKTSSWHLWLVCFEAGSQSKTYSLRVTAMPFHVENGRKAPSVETS